MPILPLLLLSFQPVACAVQDPGAQSVESQLAVARGFLLEQKYGDAYRVLQEAEQKDKGSLVTHVLLLRATLGQSPQQIEEVLAEADALKSAGKQGIELDYLYGSGFHALGARETASGQTTAMTGSLFEDSIRHLKRVVEKKDTRFDDAWTTLAEAAWYAQDFDTGLAANARAVEISPSNPWRRLSQGRLALAVYAQWQADPAKAAAAEEQWKTAVGAFEKAISLCGVEASAPELRQAQQQATMQLGSAYAWKKKREEAGDAFSKAIAIDPATADYNAVTAVFAEQELVDLLEQARDRWRSKHPESNPGDAALQWWLGYAQYGVKKLPEAAKAFESALAKNAELRNSLYYLFRIRFEQQEYAKCLEALHHYHGRSPEELVAALAYDVPGNTARLEGLIGWAIDGKQAEPLNLEAAFACELITKIVPRDAEHARHWSNLGLFLRDEGDRLRGTQGALEPAPKKFDEAQVNKLWEQALAAYEVALELEPTNPIYLNDTAVMLHYYFVRDLERAKEMYQRGHDEAERMLKRKDLSPETRQNVETARRDTGNNVKLVQKLIEKRAAEAGAKKDGKAG